LDQRKKSKPVLMSAPSESVPQIDQALQAPSNAQKVNPAIHPAPGILNREAKYDYKAALTRTAHTRTRTHAHPKPNASQKNATLDTLHYGKTEKPPSNATVGYFCFTEKSFTKTHTYPTIFWANNQFFRARSLDDNIKPLSPSYIIPVPDAMGPGVGEVEKETPVCEFLGLAYDHFQPYPPFLEGVFHFKDSSKYTFHFNPNNQLRFAVKATLYADHLLNVPLSTSVLVQFSIPRPPPNVDLSFPRVRDVRKVEDGYLD
jgi:hypothetical protein